MKKTILSLILILTAFLVLGSQEVIADDCDDCLAACEGIPPPLDVLCETDCFSSAACCIPSCGSKECGDDGCEGSCPPGCSGSETCDASGQCVPCTDTCASLGYECGTHTICGSSTNCGTCSGTDVCNAAGQCVPSGSVCDTGAFGDTCNECCVKQGYSLSNCNILPGLDGATECINPGDTEQRDWTKSTEGGWCIASTCYCMTDTTCADSDGDYCDDNGWVESRTHRCDAGVGGCFTFLTIDQVYCPADTVCVADGKEYQGTCGGTDGAAVCISDFTETGTCTEACCDTLDGGGQDFECVLGECTEIVGPGPVVCGDSKVEGTEVCDNGLDVDTWVLTGNPGEICIPTSGPSYTGEEIYRCNDCTSEETKTKCNQECGDTDLDDGEDCDAGYFWGGATCATWGYTGGPLECNADCTFNTVKCCGDGDRAVGLEQCDGTDKAGNDCTTFGFTGGTLNCNADCTFDTSACTGGALPPPGGCAAAEFELSRICAGDACVTDPTDTACCTDADSCVFNSVCYSDLDDFYNVVFPPTQQVIAECQNKNELACLDKVECIFDSGECVPLVFTRNELVYYRGHQFFETAHLTHSIPVYYEDTNADGDLEYCDPNTWYSGRVDVSGTVTGILATPLENAVVTAVSITDGVTTFTATTLVDGTYAFVNVPAGLYSMSATLAGYKTVYKTESLLVDTTVDFILEQPSALCEDDCSYAYDNICHSECNGLNQCVFYDDTAKTVCDGWGVNSIRPYNATQEIQCCTGEPYDPATKVPAEIKINCPDGQTPTIIQTPKTVSYNNQFIIMNVIVFKCGPI